jgi:hypothetical protein
MEIHRECCLRRRGRLRERRANNQLPALANIVNGRNGRHAARLHVCISMPLEAIVFKKTI